MAGMTVDNVFLSPNIKVEAESDQVFRLTRLSFRFFFSELDLLSLSFCCRPAAV